MGNARGFEEERGAGTQAEVEFHTQRHHPAWTLPRQLCGCGGYCLQLFQLIHWIREGEA